MGRRRSGKSRGASGQSTHKHRALARLDGEGTPGERRDMPGRWPRGVHQCPAAQPCAVGEPHVGDAVTRRLDRDDLACDEDGAGVTCAGTQRAKQRAVVEPSLIREAERSARNALDREPRRTGGERLAVEQLERRILRPLHPKVLLKHRKPVRPRQHEVAPRVKIRIGFRPVPCRQRTQELEPEARQADVLGRRELLADTGCGKRRRGAAKSRITLDQSNGAGKPFDDLEEVGDCRADRGAADYDHVVSSVGRHGRRPVCRDFAAGGSVLPRD